MKITELRIGSIVQLKQSKSPHHVDQIVDNGIQELIHLEGNLIVNRMDQIEGVRLNPDILENCGFKEVKARSGIMASFKNGGVRINMSNSGNYYYGNTPCSYLHLLQNLFLACEGVELTVNIEI